MADMTHPAAVTDIGFATAAKTSNAILLQEKRARKLERLKKEAKAAERKSLQKKRVLEEEGRKRARGRITMRSFFTSSRNSLNRNELRLGVRESSGAGRDMVVEQRLLTLGENTAVSVDRAVQGGSVGSRVESDIEIVLSSPAIVPVSSDSSAYVFSEDDPDFVDSKDLKFSESDLDLSADEMVDSDVDVFMPSPKKKKRIKGKLKVARGQIKKKDKRARKNYELNRKFHCEWSAKEPWSEGVLAEDGIIHMVRCGPCTAVRGKPILMAPKWDTIWKHGRRVSHKKCMALYASRQPTTVLEQIQGCNTIESRKKRIQFATLFQVLTDGRPMLEFECRFELYQFLNVPELPLKHWSDDSGWEMAEHLYDFVKQRIKTMVSAATYIALTADETSACDNSSWIAIHAYVMVNWCRVPLLLSIQKMESDGASANNLTTLIMGALNTKGGLESADVATKLLCFGADGVNAFQGRKTGVTKQIQEKYAPFTTGVHCCAHRLSLAASTLSGLGVMHAVEEVLRLTHGYFVHSPKKAAQFKALALQLQSKGLKMLKNVTTRWMSCLGPIRRLLAEYKGVMALMHADRDDKKWGKRARHIMSLLLDPYVLLSMLALLPMLEQVDTLIIWAQKQDAYICDFVGALGKCQTNLFMFYQNADTAFRKDEFHAYNQVLGCSHEQILMKWDANVNLPCEQLAFVVGGDTFYATHDGTVVTRESYAAIISSIQSDCKEAAQQLMDEMKQRFPDHGIMDALGVVYPQYWMQGDCSSSFRKHLDIIKNFYGEPQWIGKEPNKKLIPALLDKYLLESEQPLFKIAMISNCHAAMELPPLGAPPHLTVNPLTKIWRTLDANTALGKSFGEYIKLAQIAMIHVLGSVEDERTFSSLSFLKNKLRNRLDSHLGVVVGMHGQSVYTLKNFLYDDCFKQWVKSCERHRYGLTA